MKVLKYTPIIVVLLGSLYFLVDWLYVYKADIPERLRNTKIYYTTRISTDEIGLVESNPDGTARKMIFSGIVNDLELSNDGNKIAFCEWKEDFSQINIIDKEGNVLEKISHDSLSVTSPAWFDSGTKLAYKTSKQWDGKTNIRNQNLEGKIRILDIETKKTISIIPKIQTKFWEICWIENDSLIALITRIGRKNCICLIDSLGEIRKTIIEKDVQINRIRLSPNRDKILFTSYLDKNQDLYVVDIDGSNRKRLTKHKENDSGGAWSPDGSMIVFCSDRHGKNELYLINSDGTGLQRLTRTPEYEYTPYWSPFLSNKD